MVAVGIKELKAKLSEYVRAAHAGETVLITDRGEVVAVLKPAAELGRSVPGDSADARLAAAEREGALTPAQLPKAGWSWRPGSLGLAAGTTERILDDLRGDRGAE